jgi:WD40 repeat protein
MPAAFDRSGVLMVTSNAQGIDLWNPRDGTLIQHLFTSRSKPANGYPAAVDAFAITPNGTTVAANVNDRVLLLDAKTGMVLRRLDAGSYVSGMAFDPSGELLAGLTEEGGVVWDRRTGKRLWEADVPSQSALAFSIDGRLFATGTTEGVIHVFQARTGRPVGKPFVGDAGYVWSVSFNPRTGVLASTGTDGVVTLTDPRTGQTFGSPLEGTEESWSMGTWNPSGTKYILVNTDAKGYVWEMSVRDWAERACRTAGRSLTRDEWQQYLSDRPYRPACASS